MARTDDDTWDINESVGATALGVAGGRAKETNSADPLIRDPYAELFLEAAGDGIWRVYLDDELPADLAASDPQFEERMQAMLGYTACRTKFFDEYFLAAAADGIRQFVILAAGWFLAISPTMASADASRAQTAVERAHNDLLKQQNATLKEQFTHLEEYKAQLAALRVQLPAHADLSALNSELQALVASAGLTTTTFGATTAQAFAPVAAAAAPVADAAAPAATGTGAAAAGAAAPAPATSYPGFFAIPLTMTVLGTYDATLKFLDSLQTTSSRLYLVGSITATSQQDGGSSPGKPATSKGDLETTINGFTYVLQDGSAAVEAPAATPSPLPVPSTQKNPFVPVS